MRQIIMGADHAKLITKKAIEEMKDNDLYPVLIEIGEGIKLKASLGIDHHTVNTEFIGADDLVKLEELLIESGYTVQYEGRGDSVKMIVHWG